MTDTTIAHTPPEWAPQSAIWVGWPHLKKEWAGDYQGAQREIAALVKALAPVVHVKLLIGAPHSRAEAAGLIGGETCGRSPRRTACALGSPSCQKVSHWQ